MRNIPNYEDDSFDKEMIEMAFYKVFNGKKKKVRASDIQENICKINEAMKYVKEETEKTIEEMRTCDRNTQDGKARFEELSNDIHKMNLMYNALQEQADAQYKILKQYKDSKFFIAPKDWLTIGALSVLAVFVIALDRESPKITKIASFILRLMPLHI